jgi:hypothetical protein
MGESAKVERRVNRSVSVNKMAAGSFWCVSCLISIAQAVMRPTKKQHDVCQEHSYS